MTDSKKEFRDKILAKRKLQLELKALEEAEVRTQKKTIIHNKLMHHHPAEFPCLEKRV